MLTEVDAYKTATTVESGICSQCQVSGRGLIQCECRDSWYCNVCCGITEEALVSFGVVECLHFFGPPCEGEVFKAIDRRVCEDSSAISQKDFLSTITNIISKAINDFQSVMKTTIAGLLGPQNHEQPMAVDHSSPDPSHRDEISRAVSSVLKEEKEKSKRKLNIILHNILNRLLKTLIHENSMM